MKDLSTYIHSSIGYLTISLKWKIRTEEHPIQDQRGREQVEGVAQIDILTKHRPQ